MCGLVFLLDATLPPPVRGDRVANALRCLQHRGPDGSVVVSGDGFAAGHVRLAIIDLAGGRQPLHDPTGRWTLVFNGEIYNFRSLRASLESRWHFRDASDTEVLLAGLILEGERFVARLDGMWAFVLHDSVTGEVLLSRDRFGKKPLYYHSGRHAFTCASELPALKVLLPDDTWNESAAGVADYFRYGYCLPGQTCFIDVHEVLPAHTMRRAADGTLSTERYWSPSTESWRGSFERAAVEVRDRLVAAVTARQLASDVEVGAFLSGGVDSTIVCALAQQSGFGRLRTFTAGFAEPTYDERHHAARAASALGTRHVSGELSPDVAAKLAAVLPARIGQPFGDSSLVPSVMVAELAAHDVKVVLTGDGGDEVFGGYARYAAQLLLRRYRRLPRLLRTAMERAVFLFPEPMAHHSGSLLKRAHLFAELARGSANAYTAPLAMREDVLAQLVPELSAGNPVPDKPWPDDPDELRHMMLMDWLIWLPQDILAKVDRATMASSLEARSPFLDRELVEFVIRLPWQWHFSGFRGKRLLYAAMKGRTPDFIWTRRKQGFASPMSHWMRGKLGDELISLSYADDTGVVSSNALRSLLSEHRTGVVDHAQPLWVAYSYLRWRAHTESIA